MPVFSPRPLLRGWSLRRRLLVLGLIALVSAVSVGNVLVELYRQSRTDRIATAAAVTERACAEVARYYRFYATGWSGPADLDDPALRQGLRAVLAMALAYSPGIEAGIWQVAHGVLASAPVGPPEAAVMPRIAQAATAAIAEDRASGRQWSEDDRRLVLQACPLPGPIADLAAWTLTRVAPGQDAGYTRLLGGLAVLLASVLASAGWIAHLLLTWSRKLGRLEAALARHEGLDPPLLPPAGERELDRIVDSVNAATLKLRALRAEAVAMAAQVAEAERLAGLGRVAAGLAHEIRNPIAAMRLKAENALAADDARRQAALRAILAQIARLDVLLRDLLDLTHRGTPARAPTGIAALLRASAELQQELAASRGVALRVVPPAPGLCWPLDPARIGRALDNLVLNAVQSLPPGGEVVLSAEVVAGALHLSVADDGPGLPEPVRRALFEPFVSGRADGTGLGLSIVQEIARAHGGEARWRDGAPGTTFTLVLPRGEG